MLKFQILQSILQNPVVAIIRAESAAKASALVDACVDGGITALEVSFTTPDAPEVMQDAIRRHGERVLIGAGTVLDAETARIAILSGAKFILSPSFAPEVVRTCNRYQVAAMPGVATASEVVAALETGADIIKIFPGDVYGPAYLKALLAPLPQAPLMPSGGVGLDNIEDWFRAGAVAVGVGGSLTGPATVGDYAAVTRNAKAFIEAAGRPKQA